MISPLTTEEAILADDENGYNKFLSLLSLLLQVGAVETPLTTEEAVQADDENEYNKFLSLLSLLLQVGAVETPLTTEEVTNNKRTITF